MMQGHCECGRVQIEAGGEINDFSHCHCSQCRRLHGAAYATFAGVVRDEFHFISGESDISTYASSDTHQRLFCSNCGSNVLVKLATEPDTLYVSMSMIDGDPPRPPGYHIFVASKAPWHDITDDLPQYDEFSPE
jgi:hypothetical protein